MTVVFKLPVVLRFSVRCCRDAVARRGGPRAVSHGQDECEQTAVIGMCLQTLTVDRTAPP